MGQDSGSAEWEFLAEKLLITGIILVAAGSLLFFDVPGQGRLWDKLTGASSAQQEEPVMAAERTDSLPDDGRDRLLVVGAPRRSEPEAATAPQNTRTINYPKLTSQLLRLNDPLRRAAQKTSASLSMEPAPAEPSASGWTPLTTYSLGTSPGQEEGPARRAVASGRAHGNERGAIMSRSAGPVYNVTRP